MENEPLLGQLSWSAPTWDLFILIFFVAFVVLFGLTLGRGRILTALLSTYIGWAVISNLPYLTEETSQKFNLGPVFVLKLIVFGAVLVLSFFFLARAGLLPEEGGVGHLSHIFLFSVFQAGLLISIILSFVPSGTSSALSGLTRTFFVSDIARFLWILAPIVGMFLIKRESDQVKGKIVG